MAKVSLRAYNREIEAMTDRGQLDEAIAHCLHILTIFPKHLETYRLLGKAYLEYKRYKDAVDIFSRVLVVEPNDFVANVGLSIIRDEEDKLDDAIWHMERAFEVQSANPAIQGELQRLYGRREGVQPPRIRMTRGALAHMYMQGELYPQAISEVKSVLSDDAGRTDMQVLMARAYFKSGQKNEAADTASTVLRRYPYCLDANRILVEILGSECSDNSQLYRQRVIELDPYAAQVSGSIFESNEVGDAAVTLEHFEWDGKPIDSQPEWDGAKAISLESERRSQGPEAQPDWLTNGGFVDSTPPQATPKVVPPLPAAAPTFDFPASIPVASEPEPAQPTAEADIPDFLRAAGWGESTGTFDESKSIFPDEPVVPAAASDALPIEQGEMPDWLKAMAPPEVTQPAEPAQPAEEEVLPDWINKIGTGVLSTSAAAAATNDEFDWLNPSEQSSTPASDDQPDWINQMGQPASPVEANDQPDWMKQLDQPASSPVEASDQPDWMKQLDQPESSQTEANDQLDWMKQLDQPESSQAEVTDQTDWMKQLDQPISSQPESLDEPDWMKQLSQPASQEPVSSDQPDWLSGVGSATDSTPASATLEEQSDWMKQFGDQAEESAPASSVPAGDEFDFLNELTDIPSQPTSPAPVAVESLDASKQELDDSFAWLEDLGENEDASENLLTKPQEHLEEVSEWDKQVMGLDVPMEPPVSQAPVQQPVANEELGKSQPEIDDSLAWLENLAAKQGATEGLLINPEDRMEKEPDWVQKIKGTSQPAAEPTPAANVEDLGKSQSDIDDSLAWLENLAAKQGATEGLLIKPEDRKDVEPDWVQKIKSSSQPVAEPTPPVPTPAANVEDLGKSQTDIDDSLAWLENLAAKQGATEGLLIKPEDRKDVEPDWVQKIKNSSQPAAEPTPAPEPVENVEDLGKSQSEIDDSLAWLENLAAKQGATEGLLIKPEDRKDVEPDWVQKIKNSSQPAAEPTPAPTPAANVEELGKSQSEIDDSLAWFESLAAKQGATEGLLIKPEDRKDVEPDWVQKIKSSSQPAAEPTPPVPTPAANVEDLGKSQSEIDDSLAWFESLAAKQGATEGLLIKPEDRKDVEPDWVKRVKSAPQTPDETPAQPESYEQQPVDDTAAWLSSLDEEESKPEPVSVNDETAMWLQTLDEPEPVQQVAPADDMPAWLQGIGEEKEPVAESVVPAAPREAVDESDWMSAIEEPVAVSEPVTADEDIPSWLKGIDEETSIISASLPQDDLPAWMRDETGEVVAEPTKIEPTRPTDWHPIEEKQPEPPAPVVQEQPKPVEPVREKPKPVKKAASKPAEVKPSTPPAPYREPVTIRGTGMLTMPVDPILDSARSELSRSNIPGALETYAKLIKKGRFLDEVIFDLREALYRYPVEVSIWQSLGDAYMRANRLQDALDAYTKAEELLR